MLLLKEKTPTFINIYQVQRIVWISIFLLSLINIKHWHVPVNWLVNSQWYLHISGCAVATLPQVRIVCITETVYTRSYCTTEFSSHSYCELKIKHHVLMLNHILHGNSRNFKTIEYDNNKTLERLWKFCFLDIIRFTVIGKVQQHLHPVLGFFVIYKQNPKWSNLWKFDQKHVPLILIPKDPIILIFLETRD